MNQFVIKVASKSEVGGNLFWSLLACMLIALVGAFLWMQFSDWIRAVMKRRGAYAAGMLEALRGISVLAFGLGFVMAVALAIHYMLLYVSM